MPQVQGRTSATPVERGKGHTFVRGGLIFDLLMVIELKKKIPLRQRQHARRFTR
jgi:hypothetical protein